MALPAWILIKLLNALNFKHRLQKPAKKAQQWLQKFATAALVRCVFQIFLKTPVTSPGKNQNQNRKPGNKKKSILKSGSSQDQL